MVANRPGILSTPADTRGGPPCGRRLPRTIVAISVSATAAGYGAARETQPREAAMRLETLRPLGKVDPGRRAPEVALDLAAVAGDARLLEEIGYAGVVIEETKRDPYVVMALAAAEALPHGFERMGVHAFDDRGQALPVRRPFHRKRRLAARDGVAESPC